MSGLRSAAPAGLRRARLAAAARRLLLAAFLPFTAFLSPPPSRAAPSDSFTINIRPQDIWPPAPVTDLAGFSGAEGQALLQWTAPKESTGVVCGEQPVASYQVRAATFSVADLAGDTTAWFDIALPLQNPPVPLPPGSLQSLLTSLDPGTTFYFGLKSLDGAGNVSDIDLRAKAGSTQARVGVQGVAGVTNLTALPGAALGSIDLTWSEPRRIGEIAPVRYEVRVSSMGQISDDAAFAAAKNLAALSPSSLPQPGPAGGKAVLTVTGLTPSATYYFAVRMADAGAPPFAGTWKRSVPLILNPYNFAVAHFLALPADAVTDLTALPDPGELGVVDLSWTAPALPGGAPIDHYVLKVNTNSIAAAGGDPDAWFALAGSTTVVRNAVVAPGALESLQWTGLAPASTHYFAIRAVNTLGLTSLVDARAASVADQVHVKPLQIAAVTDLAAAPGAASGDIQLTWTEPVSLDLVAPLRFIVKVSTLSNIDTNAAFSAARPLSDFSPSVPPAPNGAPSRVAFTVTGLTPFTTYYFAVRMQDSQPVDGRWSRLQPAGANALNFSVPRHLPNPPRAVTDLTALTGSAEGEVGLSWSAPSNPNFTPISRYDVRYATFSAASLANDATAWFNAAQSQMSSPAHEPGTLEAFIASGLEPGALYFFGVRSIDEAGDVSPVDSLAGTLQARARSRGMQAVTDLRASQGSAMGEILLTWSEPFRAADTSPSRYELRVSTVAQISDDAGFAAAAPASTFSETVLPGPADVFGAGRSVVLTGLSPFATYYFALRARDSSVPALLGRWRRDPALGLNASNFSSARFGPMAPEPITDLTALATSAEGEAALSWTAPRNKNFAEIARYQIRFATFSVASMGGDAAAWFDLAASSQQVKAPARAPGSLETLVLSGLHASSTFYFQVRSVDVLGEASSADTRSTGGSQAFLKPLNLPPAVPSGLSAEAGRSRARVHWDALTPAGRGTDFSAYTLYRSSQTSGPYNLRAVTTALEFTDSPLAAFTTYYYRIGARDEAGLESPLSSLVAAAMPYTLRPMEPFGQFQSISASSVTLQWSSVTRFSDGELFDDPGAPEADELLGYQILRSTHPCLHFSLLHVNATDQLSFTDAVNGDVYYYQVHAFNSLGISTQALSLSSLGDAYYYLDDNASRMVLPASQARSLLKGAQGRGDDIQLSRRRRPQDAGGKILQSVEFVPMLGGVQELKDFHFDRPVPVALHFITEAGKPAAQTLAVQSQEARAQAGTLAVGADAKDLGVFWHNGVEYKKLYGSLDPVEQTVTVQTPNPGRFQIRTLLREGGVTFDLSNITSRVFTPNNDGKNDVVIFSFDNPNRAAVEGKVYDLRGAFVADMQPGPLPDSLLWDGRMNGRTVTSGVYIYQVHGEGKTFNGTVVVAR